MKYKITVHTCPYCGVTSNALICPSSRCLRLTERKLDGIERRPHATIKKRPGPARP